VRSRLVVPNLLGIMLAIFFLVLPGFSQPSMRQELIDEHARREHAETHSPDQPIASALIPPTCLPAPLPSSPRPPVFTMQAAWFGEQLRFDVWREPCIDNSGLIVPLIRATPLSGTPLVCGLSFTVVQAGIQYRIQLSNSSTSSSSSFCGDLFVPTTFLIAQSSFDPQFDDSEAFQLIYQSDFIYRLDIPPAPPSPGPSGWALVPGGGFTPSAPAATGLDDDLALFVRGTDSRLYVNWLLPTNQWTGWGLVPGGGSTPSSPAAAVWNGNLGLFVQGTDDRVYVNWLLPTNQWTGWGLVPGGGSTPSSPAAAVWNGNLGLFVQGTDSRLYVNWLLPTNQWTGWGLVPGGGFTPSSPAATGLNGNLGLFVRGTDDRVYVNWLLTNNQWTGWSAVPGGGFTPSTPAATILDDDLALFVRGEDDQLYVNFAVTGP
jgi:hypothetical protein